MKKFGFIAAAMTMLLSVASVHAAEEGINIYYDAADARNTETTRCVDVVVGGTVVNGLQAGELYFEVDEGAYVEHTFVPVAGVTAELNNAGTAYWIESEESSAVLADGILGYLMITVEANAPEFTVTLTDDSCVEGRVNGKKCDAEIGEYATVTIPAWSKGEALTVTEAGTYTYWEDGVVNAFTATLTAEQAAKTVTWTVTDGTTTKSETSTVDTTVTTEDGGVVIGLIVKNATSVQASASVK